MNSLCLACTKLRDLTNEHIVPQAIGGRLKAPIFCKECNSTFGRELDAEVANKYGDIATLLNIKRERGKTQLFEVKDNETGTILLTDGKSLQRKNPEKPTIAKDGEKLKYADVPARNDKELKKIISCINKKYKTNGPWKTFYDHHPGPRYTETKEKDFDNTILRRAISKIAYGFLCTKLSAETVLSSPFNAIRNYICTGSGPDLAHINFTTHTHFMTDGKRPLHKIHIAFNRRSNLIVGYVSIFGIFRFTILLAENFESRIEWPDFDYTFDPVRKKEIPGKILFRAADINKDDILKPRQSEQLVKKEIERGALIIRQYNDDFLGFELT